MVELEFENSSIRERIEGQLTKNNLSRASLSQLTGLSDSTINNIFSAGKHSYRLEDNNNSNIKISPQALTKIANVLNTTFNYLAYGEISKTFFKDNNGIEYVSVYEYEIFIEDISSNKSSLAKCSNGETRAYQKKYLDSFGGNYEDYFLIRNRLQGSVMSTVLPGDLLLIKKQNTPPENIRSGTFCVFSTEKCCLLGELYYDLFSRRYYMNHAYGTAEITGHIGELYPSINIERNWLYQTGNQNLISGYKTSFR